MSRRPRAMRSASLVGGIPLERTTNVRCPPGFLGCRGRTETDVTPAIFAHRVFNVFSRPTQPASPTTTVTVSAFVNPAEHKTKTAMKIGSILERYPDFPAIKDRNSPNPVLSWLVCQNMDFHAPGAASALKSGTKVCAG